jgi:hypothetical protein
MKKYVPKPINTENIELSASLLDLMEKLAANTHNVWSQARLSEGWTYGTKRDDTQKKHPGLIPYAQLPESEKEYDRRTASETLKAILKLGYTITEPE